MGRDLVPRSSAGRARGAGREPLAGLSPEIRGGADCMRPHRASGSLTREAPRFCVRSTFPWPTSPATWIELTHAHCPAAQTLHRSAARWGPDWHRHDRRVRLAGGSSGLEPGATQAAVHLRVGFAGPGPGTPTAGLSAMIVRARASVRPCAGRVRISATFPPASTLQPPPLPSVRPVAARRCWRPGRSVFRGLPAAVAPAPPLVAVAVAALAGSPGSASILQFPAGIVRPLSPPPRATMTPTARPGSAPRPAGRYWPSRFPCRNPDALRDPRRHGSPPPRRRRGKAAAGLAVPQPAHGARVFGTITL